MTHLRGRESSPHYVFLHSDDESGTDEDNISLQTIKRPSSLRRKIQVINVQIKPEDTLQALALRYRCTVSRKMGYVRGIKICIYIFVLTLIHNLHHIILDI